MTDPNKVFEVCFSGSANLKVRDIWPEGDAPENPTSADVIRVMKECCDSKYKLIFDWNLEDFLDISVIDYKVDKADW